jgi:hypothetical protein
LKSSKLKEQKDKLEEQFRKESSSKIDNNWLNYYKRS